MQRNVVLIIKDGWGVAPPTPYNAVTLAATPNDDRYLREYPHTLLEASGTLVGLPAGYQGSSEVGHLNMGAGRIVKQEVTRVNEALEDGSFFASPAYKRVLDECRKSGGALHIMGLVQDEGVHAHQDHLFAILENAARAGINRIWVHFFADGRDTPPRSALRFLRTLEEKLSQIPGGAVATLMGRYYAMDRSRNWRLTDLAYSTLTEGEGIRVSSAREAIEQGYANFRCPDGAEMIDEYLPPFVVGDYAGMKDGDGVIHFNYRQDRAIQLTMAFVEDDYPGGRPTRPRVAYCGLTRYYDSFPYNILGALDAGVGMENLLGEVISKRGLKQIRIAETQKFRHVTSFFNGKRVEPYPLEERVELKSEFDPSSYAEHPEMEAERVAEATVEALQKNEYALVVVNFANGDMVGHTGVLESAVRAVELVDQCVGKVVDAALARGYVALVTADHGNAEEMLDPRTGEPKTSHTTNPVEFICITPDGENIPLRTGGKLADIAPTILSLLELPVPREMTADNLLLRNG